MRIEAKKMKVEMLGNGVLRILTDEDISEVGIANNCKELKELEPGTIFVENGLKFVVLEQLEEGTKVTELKLRGDKKFDEDSPDWEASELREYLNTETLTEYEKMFGTENIVETETDLTTLDGLKDFGTCEDKIRIMTFEEYRKYQHLFDREEDWEWTCTPWTVKERGWEYTVCVVSPRGGIDYSVCYNDLGVRPLCILKSSIFVSLEV